jgi:HEAT repeat protein
MKNMFIRLFLLLFIALTSIQYAQEAEEKKSTITDDDIIENLLVGLESDNLGLKVSCAYYLGERKADKAVIPLMALLKGKDVAEARIMAALSLFKIGDGRGVYAIQQRAKFEDNPQVKRMCEIFYNMYLQEETVKK